MSAALKMSRTFANKKIKTIFSEIHSECKTTERDKSMQYSVIYNFRFDVISLASSFLSSLLEEISDYITLKSREQEGADESIHLQSFLSKLTATEFQKCTT